MAAVHNPLTCYRRTGEGPRDACVGRRPDTLPGRQSALQPEIDG